MSTKKITKIITVLMIVFTAFSAFSMVFASTVSIPGPSPIVGSGGTSLNNIVGVIISIIQIIAFAAAVILLMFLGIKFLTASPEGKAEIKKSAVIYIVGAVLLFAAGGILTIIQNIAISNIK